MDKGENGIRRKTKIRFFLFFHIDLDAAPEVFFIGAKNKAQTVIGGKSFVKKSFNGIDSSQGWAFIILNAAAIGLTVAVVHCKGITLPIIDEPRRDHVKMP